jgi:hypothetical protein
VRHGGPAKQRLWLGPGRYRGGCRDAVTNRDPDSHANSNRYAFCMRAGNANADANGESDRNCHSYCNCDCHADSYGNSYCYANGHSNSDAYADSYAYKHSETNPDAKRYGFAKAATDPAASPVEIFAAANIPSDR